MKPLAHGQEQGASTLSRPDDAAGLPAEATILTLNGVLTVGDLAPGARIITRDGGMAVLRAVSRRKVMTRRVRIRAGSLGHTGTEADATLPAGQPVLLRDWRARAFCGGAQAVVTEYVRHRQLRQFKGRLQFAMRLHRQQ
ncbi:Hint domain-containing protein [Roseovarius sp. SYSU LYC5161]|uniref:Hint domain-containing protein n=1 Tax=Roseovarius halophilus (ex Wu et al. 2025) TaxID=3376060 RepID=UPI00399B5EAC